MASDTTLPAQAHIRQIRLFFSCGPQVALYGSPSEVADGWIANLPAADVFAGDFSGLLYERMIDAQDAHERSPFHTPFYERHVRQEPQPHLPQQDQAVAVGPDPKLTSAALGHLNTARILAFRLAQQARRDNRPEDQHHYLAAAADASLKAADLQGNVEAAAKLIKEAFRHLSRAYKIAADIAQQARLENRPQDHQHWLSAAADAALKASDLQGDSEAATKLRKRALKLFSGASNLAARLAQQARREDRPQDRHRWLAAAAYSGLKAADLQSVENTP